MRGIMVIFTEKMKSGFGEAENYCYICRVDLKQRLNKTKVDGLHTLI